MSDAAFRGLASGARRYADELERIVGLLNDQAALSSERARLLARQLAEEITAEQERLRRSRT